MIKPYKKELTMPEAETKEPDHKPKYGRIDWPGILNDRPHKEVGRGRAARTVRNKRTDGGADE